MTPVTPELSLSGSKITTVADDINKDESQENQDLITVIGNSTVNIAAPVADLNSFASTNPSQGSGKWVGLVINTGLDDITKVNINGDALTQADVDEAASVGIGAGSFVLWLKAESTFPKTLTLSADDYADTSLTITLTDTSSV